MFSDIVYLISNTISKTDTGDTVLTPTSRMIYANKLSVRQSEHYQAQAIGLKPELMFIVRSEDYGDEDALQYDGDDYSIDRSYKKIGLTELVCTRIVGDR
jgi:SPP1 family predicted phage head-tail adaptor